MAQNPTTLNSNTNHKEHTMSEQNPETQSGDVQDPAEPYRPDQEVVTEDQPDDSDEVTTDGELNHTEQLAPEPVESAPVQVQPNAVPPAKTDKVFNKDYEVTPDRGYRGI